MQPSLKHYADYLSMGLEIGACSQSDVVAWADRLVEQNDKPEMWMIELSTSLNKHIADVDHLLRVVPGIPNLEVSFRLLMAHLSRYYPTIQIKQIRLLAQYYVWDWLWNEGSELPEEWKTELHRIGSDLDLWEWERDEKVWLEIQQNYNDLLSIGEEYKDLIV